MPDIHLYGGPNSGQTIHIREYRPWVLMASMPDQPWSATDMSFPIVNEVVHSTYVRVTWRDEEGTFRYRYVHDHIASMMRVGA